MPSGLKRFQQSTQSHFVTFTCYHRRPGFDAPAVYDLFLQVLEQMRRVPLDKSEGCVKGIVILGGAKAPPGLPCQRRLRTKTLEISP